MKRIFTLAVAVLMTTLLLAADRGPTVILNSSKNFEIVIDGRSFVANGRTITLDRLNSGRHTIRVFELRRGFRGNVQKRLVSQSSFRLRNQDLLIRVNNKGEILTKESRNRRMYNDQDYRSSDRDRDFDRDFRDEHGWRRD